MARAGVAECQAILGTQVDVGLLPFLLPPLLQRLQNGSQKLPLRSTRQGLPQTEGVRHLLSVSEFYLPAVNGMKPAVAKLAVSVRP